MVFLQLVNYLLFSFHPLFEFLILIKVLFNSCISEPLPLLRYIIELYLGTTGVLEASCFYLKLRLTKHGKLSVLPHLLLVVNRLHKGSRDSLKGL